MIEVPLTKGKVALIDEEDALRVLGYKWTANHKPDSGTWYAVTYRRGRTIYLHRFILNATAGEEVDHENLDTLDNRRCNLRLATHSQNQCNRRAYRRNKTGFKGVYYSKSRNAFCAQIRHGNVQRLLGRFATAEEAARAYDAAARAHHGDFARLNFPRQSERKA